MSGPRGVGREASPTAFSASRVGRQGRPMGVGKRRLSATACAECGRKFRQATQSARSQAWDARTVNPSAYAYAGSNPAPATQQKRASDLRVCRVADPPDAGAGYRHWRVSDMPSWIRPRPLTCGNAAPSDVKGLGVRNTEGSLGP